MSEKHENIPLWQLPDDKRAERLFLPWRRLLARAVDLVFYLLVWWVVAYFGFHWNVLLMHWLPCSIVMFAISLGVMIVLEPVFLALIGTTPGKALFGIHLRKAQGGKLSLPQGYLRILRVLAHGCGYVILPIYNFVRMYIACKDCQVEGATEWDKGIDYTYSGNFRVQTTLSIVSVLIGVVLLMTVYFSADMPKYRGQITTSQLEQNVDSYWKFHGTAWNTELFYTVNLQFYDISAGYIFDRMDPPDVVFDETNGVVTGVSFEFTDASRTVLMALPTWLRGYAVSFIGAHRDVNFIDMHFPGGILDLLLTPVNAIIDSRVGTESVSFTADGIEVSLNIEVDQFVSVSFSIKKL